MQPNAGLILACRPAALCLTAAMSLFAAGAEARECKPVPVVEQVDGWLGEFAPVLLPRTIQEWQETVKYQFGGAWSDYGKAASKSTQCKGHVNSANIYCVVSAKPCKDADSHLAPIGTCTAATCKP